MLAAAFDIVVALGLVWLAWRIGAGADLFRPIVLFISFGLLMAIAWMRLGAPDVAMAEAAVGAGITGVLLLDTFGYLRARSRAHSRAREPRPGGFGPALAAALGGLLAGVALAVPQLRRAGALVSERLMHSGVESEVTAVLLNFRSLDTLLEIAVLLLAVIGVFVIGRSDPEWFSGRWRATEPPSPMLSWFLPRLVPVAVLVAGYLWWAGAYQPGGAFQGGTVLAAAAVLLLLGGILPARLPGLRLRAVAVLGLSVFLAVGLAVSFAGRVPLDYPPGWQKPLIVLIEFALTVSIGAGLFLLVRMGSISSAPGEGEGS